MQGRRRLRRERRVREPKGLDVEALARHAKAHRSLEGAEKATAAEKMSDPMELLEIPVDILVPAALENQVTKHNAARVRARLVAEGANGPLTRDADEILGKKGIFVIPDILCNAGGVTVSYLEWVQNRTGYYWRAERVQEDLSRLLREAFRVIYETAEQHAIDMRTAAFVVAIQRVTRASEMRGLYA